MKTWCCVLRIVASLHTARTIFDFLHDIFCETEQADTIIALRPPCRSKPYNVSDARVETLAAPYPEAGGLRSCDRPTPGHGAMRNRHALLCSAPKVPSIIIPSCSTTTHCARDFRPGSLCSSGPLWLKYSARKKLSLDVKPQGLVSSIHSSGA